MDNDEKHTTSAAHPAPPPEVVEDAAGERENPKVAQDDEGTPKEQPWGAP